MTPSWAKREGRNYQVIVPGEPDQFVKTLRHARYWIKRVMRRNPRVLTARIVNEVRKKYYVASRRYLDF